MNLFDDDTVSINESAINPLKVGKFPYRIVGAKPHEADGKLSVVFSFQPLNDKTRHGVFFGISAEGDQGRIAKQGVKALWDATGLAGKPGLDRLPNFIDKVVEIDAYENSNSEGKKFVNIRAITPYNGTVPAKQEYNQPEDDDKIDTSPSTPAAEPVTPQEATAPAPSTKPKKWPGAKK